MKVLGVPNFVSREVGRRESSASEAGAIGIKEANLLVMDHEHQKTSVEAFATGTTVRAPPAWRVPRRRYISKIHLGEERGTAVL